MLGGTIVGIVIDIIGTMKTTKVAITLPKTQLERATSIAKTNFGYKFPELVRYLLAKYIDANQELVSRLEREYQTHLLEEQIKPSKVFTNADDLIADLENEN